MNISADYDDIVNPRETFKYNKEEKFINHSKTINN